MNSKDLVDNDLIKLIKNFSLVEFKIFVLILSNLQLQEEKNSLCILNMKSIYSIFKENSISNFNNQSYIKNTLINLVKNGILSRGDIRNKVVIAPLISSIVFNENKCFINISEYWFKELLLLSNYFSTIELLHFLKFNSSHSLELYFNTKYFLGSQDECDIELTTKELKDIFGLDKDMFVYKGHFLRTTFENRCLNVALVEINQKTDVFITMKKVKVGSRVKEYKFNIKRKVIKMNTLFGTKKDVKPKKEVSKSQQLFSGAKSIMLKNNFSENVINSFIKYLAVYVKNRGLVDETILNRMISSLINLRDVEGYADWALLESIDNSRGKIWGSFYPIINYENKNFIHFEQEKHELTEEQKKHLNDPNRKKIF